MGKLVNRKAIVLLQSHAKSISVHVKYYKPLTKKFSTGRVFTMPFVSLNIPEGVLFTDLVKRLKHRCFLEKVS